MNVSIREFQYGDEKLVKNFIERVQDFIVTTDPVKRIRRQPKYGEVGLLETCEKIANKKGKIYFAEVDTKVVGYIFGYVCDQQTEDNLLEVVPTQIGEIMDIFIEEEFRKLGIGKMLITKMEDYFKAEGCDTLWLEVFAPNTNAHNAYLNLGFVDREIGMLKKIE